MLIGTLLAFVMYPGISVGIALMIGAVLAPTDAALEPLPVITNKAVPPRIRRVLNVESGLNDPGIATPFVFLALALATAESTGASSWVAEAVINTMVGVLVGIGIGIAGGYLLRVADSRRWTTPLSRQLFVLALVRVVLPRRQSASEGNGFHSPPSSAVSPSGFGADDAGGRGLRFTEAPGLAARHRSFGPRSAS